MLIGSVKGTPVPEASPPDSLADPAKSMQETNNMPMTNAVFLDIRSFLLRTETHQ
jgi:hypothetical protein